VIAAFITGANQRGFVVGRRLVALISLKKKCFIPLGQTNGLLIKWEKLI
jgi:hypothetical protein